MEALKNLFIRIIPLTLLVMFLALGLAYGFNIPLTSTVLSTKTFNGITIYTIDMHTYIENVTTNYLDIVTTDTLNQWNTLQNLFDDLIANITNTTNIQQLGTNMLSLFLLLINGVIYLINCLLLPFRYIGAIMLTGQNMAGVIRNWPWRTSLINFVTNGKLAFLGTN